MIRARRMAEETVFPSPPPRVTLLLLWEGVFIPSLRSIMHVYRTCCAGAPLLPDIHVPDEAWVSYLRSTKRVDVNGRAANPRKSIIA